MNPNLTIPKTTSRTFARPTTLPARRLRISTAQRLQARQRRRPAGGVRARQTPRTPLRHHCRRARSPLRPPRRSPDPQCRGTKPRSHPPQECPGNRREYLFGTMMVTSSPSELVEGRLLKAARNPAMTPPHRSLHLLRPPFDDIEYSSSQMIGFN